LTSAIVSGGPLTTIAITSPSALNPIIAGLAKNYKRPQ
jgi:hypothetical protein